MSTCQDFEFFEAGPEWQEKILKLWRQVFVSWSDETAEIIADRLNSGFLTGTVRLAAVRNRRTGELIAAVRLEDAMFAGNSGEDRKGIHVGEVAVLPAYQGCGAGTFLMKNAMALIKEVPRDGSFAFLGGYANFYRRFGFERAGGQTFLEVRLTPERGGTRRFPVLERIPRPPAEMVRKLNFVEDRKQILFLQPRIPGQRVFTREIFDREFCLRKSCFELDCFVSPASENFKGYLFRCGNTVYSFSIQDAGIAASLLCEALHRIAEDHCDKAVISCNLEFAENFLKQYELPFSKISSSGGLCSQMRMEL